MRRRSTFWNSSDAVITENTPGVQAVVDTIFNEAMHPVFVNEPAEVKRRLRAPHPESWTRVCIGETQQIVTVTEYLYEEKYKDVLAMVQELLRKQGLAMYQRHPERLKVYIESAARKIIERAMQD